MMGRFTVVTIRRGVPLFLFLLSLLVLVPDVAGQSRQRGRTTQKKDTRVERSSKARTKGRQTARTQRQTRKTETARSRSKSQPARTSPRRAETRTRSTPARSQRTKRAPQADVARGKKSQTRSVKNSREAPRQRTRTQRSTSQTRGTSRTRSTSKGRSGRQDRQAERGRSGDRGSESKARGTSRTRSTSKARSGRQDRQVERGRGGDSRSGSQARSGRSDRQVERGRQGGTGRSATRGSRDNRGREQARSGRGDRRGEQGRRVDRNRSQRGGKYNRYVERDRWHTRYRNDHRYKRKHRTRRYHRKRRYQRPYVYRPFIHIDVRWPWMHRHRHGWRPRYEYRQVVYVNAGWGTRHQRRSQVDVRTHYYHELRNATDNRAEIDIYIERIELYENGRYLGEIDRIPERLGRIRATVYRDGRVHFDRNVFVVGDSYAGFEMISTRYYDDFVLNAYQSSHGMRVGVVDLYRKRVVPASHSALFDLRRFDGYVPVSLLPDDTSWLLDYGEASFSASYYDADPYYYGGYKSYGDEYDDTYYGDDYYEEDYYEDDGGRPHYSVRSTVAEANFNIAPVDRSYDRTYQTSFGANIHLKRETQFVRTK